MQAVILSYFTAPTGIYLYSTVGTYQGNLAAFGTDLDSSLTNICRSNRILGQIINLTCMNILPFVSTTANPLNNFPTNYSVPVTNTPVRGARGDIIGTDWNQVFSTAPLVSAAEAGVILDEFWTFTGSIGSYDSTNNCATGTSAANTSTGRTGDPHNVTIGWFTNNTPGCDQFKKVLCICY